MVHALSVMLVILYAENVLDSVTVLAGETVKKENRMSYSMDRWLE